MDHIPKTHDAMADKNTQDKLSHMTGIILAHVKAYACAQGSTFIYLQAKEPIKLPDPEQVVFNALRKGVTEGGWRILEFQMANRKLGTCGLIK